MPTVKNTKLIKIEALRGFAALYVVLHHTVKFDYRVVGINLGEILRFGQEAVILFFLLSGFVINFAYKTSKNPDFRTYFFKRFFRIYLPLVAVFFIGFLTESFNAGSWFFPDVSQAILNLAMLQDWAFAKPNVIVEPLFNNTPLWSLSYEWWFYMLYFPITKYGGSFKTQSSLVFLLAIISAITYTIYPTFLPRLLMYLSIWWTGVWLSEQYISGKQITFKNSAASLLAMSLVTGILVLSALKFKSGGGELMLGIHPVLEVRHFLFAIFVVLGALAWQRFHWKGFGSLFRPFLFLAPISYTIYIAHYSLMTSATYLSFIGHPVVEWVCYLSILLVVSWFIERKLYLAFIRSPSVKRIMNPIKH